MFVCKSSAVSYCLSLILIVFLYSVSVGCATVSIPLSSTPSVESDFRLPPEELKDRFPDVSGLHPHNAQTYYINRSHALNQYRPHPPGIDSLVELWGQPQGVDADSARLVMLNGFMSSIFLPILLTQPVEWAILTSIQIPFSYLAYDQFKTYRWDKGDYRILARTTKSWSGDELHSWDWIHLPTDKKNSIDPYEVSPWYFHSSMGSTIFRSNAGKLLFDSPIWLGGGLKFHSNVFFDDIRIEVAVSAVSYERSNDKNLILQNRVLNHQSALVITNWRQENFPRSLGLGIQWEGIRSQFGGDVYQQKIGLIGEIEVFSRLMERGAARLGYFYGMGADTEFGHSIRMEFSMAHHSLLAL